MRLKSKEKQDWGTIYYSLEMDKPSQESCFALADFECRMGTVKNIDVIEEHDAGDLYGSIKGFKSRDEFRKWKDSLSDDYILDRIEIRMDIQSADVFFGIKYWSYTDLKGTVVASFDTEDEKVGDKIANTIVKHFE